MSPNNSLIDEPILFQHFLTNLKAGKYADYTIIGSDGLGTHVIVTDVQFDRRGKPLKKQSAGPHSMRIIDFPANLNSTTFNAPSVTRKNPALIQTLFYDNFSSNQISFYQFDNNTFLPASGKRPSFIRSNPNLGFGGSTSCMEIFTGDDTDGIISDARRQVEYQGPVRLGAEFWFNVWPDMTGDTAGQNGYFDFIMQQHKHISPTLNSRMRIRMHPENVGGPPIFSYAQGSGTEGGLSFTDLKKPNPGLPQLRTGMWNYMNMEADYFTNKFLHLQINDIVYDVTIYGLPLSLETPVGEKSCGIEIHAIPNTGGAGGVVNGGSLFIGAVHLYKF